MLRSLAFRAATVLALCAAVFAAALVVVPPTLLLARWLGPSTWSAWFVRVVATSALLVAGVFAAPFGFVERTSSRGVLLQSVAVGFGALLVPLKLVPDELMRLLIIPRLPMVFPEALAWTAHAWVALTNAGLFLFLGTLFTAGFTFQKARRDEIRAEAESQPCVLCSSRSFTRGEDGKLYCPRGHPQWRPTEKDLDELAGSSV